jgi:phage terminase large subunit
MNSIDESVHDSLKSEIEELNMSGLYDVKKRSVDGMNGTAIRYAGLKKAVNIKSYSNFDICWLEEGEYISQRSLDILIRTIRKDNSEIWISFNPESEFSAVWLLIKPYLDEVRANGYYEDEDFYIARVNLSDNPFAPEIMVKDSAKLKSENYKKWLHIFGGEPYSDYEDSIIQPEWVEAAINSHVKLGFKPSGMRSLGFDPADTGDNKCLAAVHGPHVYAAKHWSSGELPDAIDTAFDKAFEWRVRHMVYDDDGLGKSMKVYLRNNKVDERLKLNPYNGNGTVLRPDEPYNPDDDPRWQVTNRDRYRNRRAQTLLDLADRFEATYNAVKNGIYTAPERLISLDPDLEDLDILKIEAISPKILRGKPKKQVESKKDMLKRGVASTNWLDALGMAFSYEDQTPKTSPVTLNCVSEFSESLNLGW